MFPIEFPVLVNDVSIVFHAIHHCMVMGTLIFIFIGYMYDPFTCCQIISMCGWSVKAWHITLKGDPL